MAKKLKVAILFGGRSAEHNISLLSAKNVIDAIDRTKFIPILIGIDKSGKWHYNEGAMKIVHTEDPRLVALNALNAPILLSQNANDHQLISLENQQSIGEIDVIFPVLHGTYGEDGSVQGLAKLANLPCVGCGILGSAVGMDKDVTKRLLRDSGIGVADFITLRRGFNEDLPFGEITKKIGNELFIKPANLGSSVGVSFVSNEKDYNEAIVTAFEYDPKVIVEEKITGREIECAVMGNENPQASIIGEIIPKDEWYSFESKYVDADGAKCQIPADLDPKSMKKAQNLAILTYRLLECEGLTRVDMFLQANGELIVNEVNTIPGFTKISMYPQLWAYSGINYTDLISRLIEYAIESNNYRNSLKNT
jgi:D-alanine-D-alanine ligase